jgi:hypothetical protein
MEKTGKKPSREVAQMTIIVNILVLLQNIYILDKNSPLTCIGTSWLILTSLYAIYSIVKITKWLNEEPQKPL